MKKLFLKIYQILKYHNAAFAIMVVLTAIGIWVANQYGIAWDEYVMRDLGYMDYNFVTKGANYKPNPFYGPIIELPLVILEVKLHITDYQTIFIMRHLVCHLLFLAGAIALYGAIFGLFKNRVFALLALLLYFTFPTLYAHSFFNSKDTPFLSLFSLAFFALYKSIESPKWFWFVVLGILTGFLINSRIIGVVFLPAIALSFITAMIVKPKEFPPGPTILKGLLMLAVTMVSLYVTWPLLWHDPVNMFLQILSKSSNYTFFGANNLFNGVMLNSNKLPFWYLPAWMGITIPLAVQILALVGFVSVSVGFMKPSGWRNVTSDGLFKLALLVVFVLPLMAVMILHSPLFDGWRHMYFLYLMVLIFALYGLKYLLEKQLRFINVGIVLLLVFHGFTTIKFMVKEHPYQNLYFNELVSKGPENIRRNYDFDFWGTSYREGLEFILKDSKADSIKVLAANSPGRFNQFIFTQKQRNRLIYVDSAEDGDYFISNYRWHPNEYPFKKMVFSRKVNGSTVIAVWKIQPDEKNIRLWIDK